MIKKNEKGITMVILVITVLLLSIITVTLANNSMESFEMSGMTRLDNDIELLNDRVATYYVEHEKLPTLGDAYTKSELEGTINDLSANDGDEYYTLDLSKLSNVSLNYGSDYQTQGKNSYIINVESHVIYYLKGVSYQGNTYHTLGEYPAVTLDI